MNKSLQQAYISGFISKCAEYNANPDAVIKYARASIKMPAWVGGTVRQIGRYGKNIGRKMQNAFTYLANTDVPGTTKDTVDISGARTRDVIQKMRDAYPNATGAEQRKINERLRIMSQAANENKAQLALPDIIAGKNPSFLRGSYRNPIVESENKTIMQLISKLDGGTLEEIAKNNNMPLEELMARIPSK